MRNFGYGFTFDEICNKAAALYSCQLAAVQQARSYTKSKAKLFFSQQAFQRPRFWRWNQSSQSAEIFISFPVSMIIVRMVIMVQ